MTIKKDKGLTFDNKNAGAMDIKEVKNNYYSDTFEPGQTKQRLKIGREVEGEVASSSSSRKTLAFTIATGTDGNTSLTGFGFTPTSCDIEAVPTSSQGEYLYSKSANYDTTSIGLKFTFEGTEDVSFAYDLDNNADRSNGSFEGFETDGLLLDVRNSDFDTKLIVTAYS